MNRCKNLNWAFESCKKHVKKREKVSFFNPCYIEGINNLYPIMEVIVYLIYPLFTTLQNKSKTLIFIGKNNLIYLIRDSFRFIEFEARSLE